MTEVEILSALHYSCLRTAFIRLLGQPSEGTMVFVRCLASSVIDALSGPEPLNIPGWEVYAVVGESTIGTIRITADYAIDIREAKQGSVLLLVDERNAGTGIHGIYSAVREIGERALMDSAIEATKLLLSASQLDMARKACHRARRLGRLNAISPWREFDFYARCAANPNAIGAEVAWLGLWPIANLDESALGSDDIDRSALVAERLLLTSGAALTPRGRVDSLLLQRTESEQARQLESLLRETEGMRWTDAVVRAQNFPRLWLNAIHPGFYNQQLMAIELVKWRSRTTAAPLKWSGLILAEADGLPRFLLHPDERERAKTRLCVKWKVTPADLGAGAVTYRVAIVTGQENELASQEVNHTGRETQQCIFTGADFAELDSDGKWEVKVVVHPVGERRPGYDGDSPCWTESEEFELTFGSTDGATTANGVGRKARALVEEAVKLSPEEFLQACACEVKEDRQACFSYRVAGKSGRIFRPPLLRTIEEAWSERSWRTGRWRVQVREDGSLLRVPEFVEIEKHGLDSAAWRRQEDASRLLGQQSSKRGGFLGLIHHDSERTTEYVNAWAAALEAAHSAGRSDLALAHTLEVQSLDGTTRGLIVLPSHPLRVAWNQGYDELAFFARYRENMKATESSRATDAVKALRELDGGFFPAFLPGLREGEAFVFGDTLGFYAVAMTRHNEVEPQATIALLARCLASSRDQLAMSVGLTTAQAVAREISKYAGLHAEYDPLRIHALRAGDGFTVAQALGLALRPDRSPGRFVDDIEDGGHSVFGSQNGIQPSPRPGYRLDVFPSAEARDARLSGRFLAETAERRRAGVGAVPDEDRWMLTTYDKDGTTQPRLKWARRNYDTPREPAHVALAFDTFDSTLDTVAEVSLSGARALEVFGLLPAVYRTFSFHPTPTWSTTVAPTVEGDKHPYGRALTDRLLRLHGALLRLVAASLGGEIGSWPVLNTRITAEKAESIRRLHELSDWVVTIDRNAGIEYFDAPREAGDLYKMYVIDCVPERQDLDFVQLVTSTNKIDEVINLLGRALAEMNLSGSPHDHASFLLDQLKAVSGRLAMRLSGLGSACGELIALALFVANCLDAGEDDSMWPSLRSGFLVPLDDVRDLLFRNQKDVESGPPDDADGVSSALRADLVHVSLSRRGMVQFQFIEIKYRRALRTAVDPSLRVHMREQTARTRERWMGNYFGAKLTVTQIAVRRKRLVRALRFYADKARRHNLPEDMHRRLLEAIDRLHRTDADTVVRASEDRGYIFCLDHSGRAVEMDFDGATRIFRFGPDGLPDTSKQSGNIDAASLSNGPPPPSTSTARDISGSSTREDTVDTDAPGANAESPLSRDERLSISASSAEASSQPHGGGNLLLGRALVGETPISWNVSIQSNPHLMIVGQPGTGKTYTLVRLCRQLRKLGIVPIIFDFHGDIEEGLASLGEPLRFSDVEEGIGFNPMRVVRSGPTSWIDNVADLRDIFSSVYPDLGDVQTSEIREALKESYTEQGYGASDRGGMRETPPFQRFFDILRNKQKPNTGILARLGELNDYGFFRHSKAVSSLLESPDAVIVRLFRTQNEVLQNALASFVLFNIYQNMFLRGPQSGLTHAILFDEAHRASHLKLIPTMAKECRKYGLAMIVASQEAKDFNHSLFSAISNYLVLRVTESDAKFLARNVGSHGEVNELASRMKSLADRTALFFRPGKRPTTLALES